MELSLCKYCGEKIVFLKTRAGKWISIDLSCVNASNIKATLFDKTTMAPHFATCKNAPPRAEPAPDATSAQAFNRAVPGANAAGFAGGPNQSNRADLERQQAQGARQAAPPDDEPPPLTDDDF